MSFRERLLEIRDRIDGAVALSLVDSEGIAVESVGAESGLDLESLGAELLTQAKAISTHHRDLGVGTVQQLSVTTDQMSLIVSAVSSDYYLLLAIRRRGSYGRARFELLRARLELEPELT